MTIFRCDPLHVLQLQPRTTSILLSAGIRTVGELTDKTLAELMRVPKFGFRTATDCENSLEVVGLRLRPERSNKPSCLSDQLKQVQLDRDSGVLVKSTAEKLGVSSARVSQLRRRVEAFERRQGSPDVEVLGWGAQYEGVSS